MSNEMKDWLRDNVVDALQARIAELEAENQRLRDGISLHRADTKMRAGSLWGASQEDATLWALLGGGE